MILERMRRAATDTFAAFFLAVVVGTALVLGVALIGRGGASGAAGPATPLPTCQTLGTPTARGAELERGDCAPGALDEPVAVDGMTLTLSLSSEKAAPQTITVEIVDGSGEPVEDATVEVVNRHLEMDHGDFFHPLEHAGEGRYEAAKVGMGMGGRWQTEIRISRPERETVTVVYAIRLRGIGE